MIPEHVMRELRYIEVYTAKRIRTLRVGPYTSPLRGPGFDFDEHQLYRQGDDVRRIDWNVTARMGAPYVRHTHAERELNVMIAIDVSRSMELGAAHRSKKELMTFITGSLLFSAVSDQINTGFIAFSDRVLEFSPPRRTRAAAWNVLERCWALSPRPGRTADRREPVGAHAARLCGRRARPPSGAGARVLPRADRSRVRADRRQPGRAAAVALRQENGAVSSRVFAGFVAIVCSMTAGAQT